MLPQKVQSNVREPTHSRGRKRKTAGDGDESERKSKRNQRGLKEDSCGSSIHDEPEEFFACPFSILNPRKYPWCKSKTLLDVDRLRQHIKRAHFRQDSVCDRCLRNFRDDYQSLRDHAKDRKCQIVSGRDELFEDDLSLLDTRRGSSDREQWFQIWDQLFSIHPHPLSPYISQLGEYSASNFPGIIASVTKVDPSKKDDVKESLLTEKYGYQKLLLDFPWISEISPRGIFRHYNASSVAKPSYDDMVQMYRMIPAPGTAREQPQSNLQGDPSELFPLDLPAQSTNWRASGPYLLGGMQNMLPPSEAAALEIGPHTDSGYGTFNNSTKPGGEEARPYEATELEIVDGGATTYSDSTSLRDPALDKYVEAFTGQLRASLSSRIPDSMLVRVASEIEELLREFGHQVLCEGDSTVHRTLMYLVHRYYRRIVQDLCDIHKATVADDQRSGHDNDQWSGHDDDQGSGSRNDDPGITGEDKSQMWINSTNFAINLDQEAPMTDFLDDPHWGEDDDNLPIHLEETKLADYRDFLMHDSAYQRLVARVTSLSDLEVPGLADAYRAIGDAIKAKFKRRKHISRNNRMETSIEFHFIDWNIAKFYKEQQYSCSLDQVLVEAITLTGWDNDVQATTCLEYVERMWGESGLKVQSCLQKAIIETGEVHTVTFPCGTTVQVKYTNDSFDISASGSPITIAEIGEQLSWLSASLRSSPWNGRGVAYCMPTVSVHDIPDIGDRSASSADIGPARSICTIQVQFDGANPAQTDDGIHGIAGSCWRQCLHSPVVVTGYPIPRRMEHGRGLEVSVGVMASLANAKYLVEWGGRTVLKGFSTMLAVSKVEESAVFWHLFYNERGNYISYDDFRVPRVKESHPSLVLDDTALSTRRHILGWCEKVEILAGSASPEVNYDIESSRLRQPAQWFAWDKISISAGKILTVGAGISIGIKDKPEHISYEDDYISTVDMIADRYFVFYDPDERRACLLDGGRALLHLLRAFIEQCLSSRRLGHLCEFKRDDFQNNAPEGVDAAFWVLVNEQNQLHPLWKKMSSPSNESSMELGEKLKNTVKTTWSSFCVKDKVLQICRVLQQISAHVDDVHSSDGVGAKIKFTPRRQMEGFEFRDIAASQGTIWPKAAELCATGFGWIDLTREIGAIPIFGTGFGELFKPVGKPCQLCMVNTPHGGDLLAIAVSDIKTIINKWGKKRASPLCLVAEQIQWHSPDKAFEPCACGNKSISSPGRKPRHDRVQVLLPMKFPKLWVKNPRSPSLGSLPEQGALLFGHSRKFPLRFGATGTPEKGSPECSCYLAEATKTPENRT